MTNAQILDQKAVKLSAEYLQTEGQILTVLIAMKKKNLFIELNYSGIFEYCQKRLKFSDAQSYYFKTVAEKSIQVPALHKAVSEGAISVSQARRIVPVLNEDNQFEWIEKAKNLEQKDLEKEVTAINPKARVKEKIRPIAKEASELKVEISSTTEKQIKELQNALSQKLGRAATLVEVVEWMAETTYEQHHPEQKAKRILSSGKLKPGQEPRRVTPRLKKQVIAKDGYQCMHVDETGRRCSQRKWLDFHHIIPREEGGKHTMENLEIRCKAHHKYEHRMMNGRAA